MSIFKTYTEEELTNLFSQFLISSWSYSKVSEFSRNEKSFEMSYIYNYQRKNSSSSVAGSAYHKALEHYFIKFKDGIKSEITELEQIAFEHIDSVHANDWKLQKTTPTVEECKQKAVQITVQLLRNFYAEIGTYIDDIKQIIDVESYCNEFLTINGVDIPLPCHAMIDVAYTSIDDKIVIVDHKSKGVFTDEESLKLTIGRQAITYVNCFEAKTGDKVDEVLFIENKYSKNRDGSAQLNSFRLAINDDVRKLYEALLYEPLRRMITAVNDPDYVYMINDQDNYVDKAELYNFWAKTMIAEVEEFNVDPTKKELISKRLKKIRDASIKTINPKIIKNFKENAASFIQYDLSNLNMTQEEKIQHVLRSFGIIVNVAHKFDGYSSNTYLLEISAGVKVTSIHNHKLDIANALDVSTVRISKDLVVHQGKSYLAIEFSKKREVNLDWDITDLVGNKLPIGRDNFGNVIHWDLDNQSTPHVLICGATGSGKSVSIRSTIEYAKRTGIEHIVIFDPKYEFLSYKRDSIVQVYNEIIEIEEEMKNLVDYMNTLVKNGEKSKILVVFDEFADALSASRKGNELKVYEERFVGVSAKGIIKTQVVAVGELKSLEENLRVLLQKGRSTGFRIMAATQRASVKVITGDAKVNFPVQICFRVPKEIDSKVVLDEAGAEGLGGMGDGLIKSPEYPETVRFQAYWHK
jgi:S-DNA-T family DNA segregation ATPase FtsK/SpoIIIE